jgi:hypothetical protein
MPTAFIRTMGSLRADGFRRSGLLLAVSRGSGFSSCRRIDRGAARARGRGTLSALRASRASGTPFPCNRLCDRLLSLWNPGGGK